MKTILDCFNAGLTRTLGGQTITDRAMLDGWITVHPNGQGTEGVPVLLGPDGTVQGGMGGKFNGQHISQVGGGNTPVKMTAREYLTSKGVSWNAPSDPTLHHNRNKVERRHQEALRKLSEEQNEWFNKKQKLLAEYEQKVKRGEITQPSATETLSKLAAAKPDMESGQAAARLLAKIEARKALRAASNK